jgi:predicted SAM-dependent methyltransferase
MPVVLDLGCGTTPRPGAIGIDHQHHSRPDLVADLNRYPYPLKSSSADEIHLDNVLEHLEDVVATMEELHRIARPGGLVRIVVPYFRSRWAVIDPTHRHQFSTSSMSYFERDHPNADRYEYSTARFSLERLTFNQSWSKRGPRAALARWASANPERYESRLSHLIPLDELVFELRADKL